MISRPSARNAHPYVVGASVEAPLGLVQPLTRRTRSEPTSSPVSWYRPHPALAGVVPAGLVSATTKRRLPSEEKQIWPWGSVPSGAVPAAMTRWRV